MIGRSNIIIILILFHFTCTLGAACRMGHHGTCPNETLAGLIVTHCNTTGDCNGKNSDCKGFETCSVEVIGNGSTVSRCRCSKGYNRTYTFYNYMYTVMVDIYVSIGANIGAAARMMCAFALILVIFVPLYRFRERLVNGLHSRHLKHMLLASSLLCLVALTGLYRKQLNNMDIKSILFKDYRTRWKSMQNVSINCKVSEITSRYCTNDCIRLRNLVKDWPDGKPKAFVYYLIQAKRISILSQSLSSLDSNFNDVYHYPIVIFHENISDVNQNLIRLSSKSDIYFQAVKFEVPDFLPKNLTQLSCHWHIGYRHMCRFHSKLVYEQPITCGFEYAWRLDDDSIIKRPIKYDIFEYMRDNNLQYGYIAIIPDNRLCTVNLWENTRKYINDSSIAPKFFTEWRQYYVYYNNFEVSRMSIWLSDDYQKFIDYIDKLGGIYYYRWGDAPIKSIAVSLFVRKNETHNFLDVGYQHKKLNHP